MSLIDGTQMIYCKGPFTQSAERSGVDAHSVNVVIVFNEFDYNGHARTTRVSLRIRACSRRYAPIRA